VLALIVKFFIVNQIVALQYVSFAFIMRQLLIFTSLLNVFEIK